MTTRGDASPPVRRPRAAASARPSPSARSNPPARSADLTEPGELSASAQGGAAQRRPELLDTRAVLALQRRAGNSTVNRLVRSVQRAPLGKDADPEGYTEAAGKANVAGSGTTRREVRGLSFGVKGGFSGSYTSKKHPEGVASDESSMTKENPDHMAVIVMPDKVVATRPVQVIVHFAGFGFRGGARGDPYAGYTVASGYKRGQREIKKGTVRDVDQEHWEQQIGAVNKERAGGSGPQVVAILAQGRGMSDFGNVPTFDYVRDVLGHVPELKSVTEFSIILSGHSGGGATQIASKVENGDARTADRAALPAAKKGKAAPQPADLVVLFDAEGVERVTAWATGQIAGLAKALGTAGSPADAKAAIAATPKFRGYFWASGSYAKRYTAQNKVLGEALAKVPAEWARPDPAHPSVVTVADLFRFIPISGKGVDHEHVISHGTDHPAEEGALADALRASADPTRDRAEELKPESAPAKKPRKVKASAKVKPAAATDPAPITAPATTPKAPTTAPPTTAPTTTAPTTTAPTTTAPTTTAPTKTVPRPTTSTASSTSSSALVPGWRKADATSDYQLTQADRTALAAQTPAERAQDQAAFDKKARARLAVLTRAEKKGALDDGEAQELITLRRLQARITAAQGALKRKDVDDVLAKAGHTVADWYGQVQKGSFLNVSLRVHRALAERLTRAETALVADPKVNPDKLKAADLGVKLKMYASSSDMRRPKAATGGKNLSMHTFGLAVDLNYKGNPFLGNAGKLAPDIVKRATGLVLGTPIDVMKYIGEAKEAFTTLRSASEALQTYLSYRDAANLAVLTEKVGQHTKLKGEPAEVAGWVAQIEKDHKSLAGAKDFAGHKPAEEGFIDFDEAVVLALTGAGLTWGGTYPKAKDVMHFDLRQGDGAKVDAERKAHQDNT